MGYLVSGRKSGTGHQEVRLTKKRKGGEKKKRKVRQSERKKNKAGQKKAGKFKARGSRRKEEENDIEKKAVFGNGGKDEKRGGGGPGGGTDSTWGKATSVFWSQGRRREGVGGKDLKKKDLSGDQNVGATNRSSSGLCEGSAKGALHIGNWCEASKIKKRGLGGARRRGGDQRRKIMLRQLLAKGEKRGGSPSNPGKRRGNQLGQKKKRKNRLKARGRGGK